MESGISMLRMVGGKPQDGLPVWRLNQVLSIIQDRIQKLSDDGRWAPLVWSSMHMYSTTQLGKLVALKRCLDPEFAGLVCAFHDIYTLHTGEYEDHDKKAANYIREIVMEYNERWGEQLSLISNEEVERIIIAIEGHSDKITVTNDPYAELLKDVDSIDAHLHGLKPQETALGRQKRLNMFFTEFQIQNTQHKLE
jgi:uncharacterized protein